MKSSSNKLANWRKKNIDRYYKPVIITASIIWFLYFLLIVFDAAEPTKSGEIMLLGILLAIILSALRTGVYLKLLSSKYFAVGSLLPSAVLLLVVIYALAKSDWAVAGVSLVLAFALLRGDKRLETDFGPRGYSEEHGARDN